MLIYEIDLEKQLVDNTEECIICYYNKNANEYIIFECNHKVCIECYRKLNKCPICLKPFDRQIEIITSTSSTRATISTIDNRQIRENREHRINRSNFYFNDRMLNLLCNVCCFCFIAFFIIFNSQIAFGI